MKIDKLRLFAGMAEQGYNYKTLAEKAKVSRPTLSYINSGKNCTPETAGKIAHALGVNVLELIEKEG